MRKRKGSRYHGSGAAGGLIKICGKMNAGAPLFQALDFISAIFPLCMFLVLHFIYVRYYNYVFTVVIFCVLICVQSKMFLVTELFYKYLLFKDLVQFSILGICRRFLFLYCHRFTYCIPGFVFNPGVLIFFFTVRH
jgi:hypothetical protein